MVKDKVIAEGGQEDRRLVTGNEDGVSERVSRGFWKGWRNGVSGERGKER